MTNNGTNNGTNHGLILLAIGALSGLPVIGCAAEEQDDAKPVATDAGARRAMPAEAVLELAPPERGAQVATVGREIPAGADEEWCEVVELPGDAEQTFFVGRTELAMTPFSHHIIVSIAPEGSTSLDDAELGAPERCLGAHRYGNDLVTLAASARPYDERVLPEGIGFVVRGRQRLVFDYHALNTSPDPVLAAHELNLHFVERIERPARTFGFYNQYIEIPAHTSRAFADQSC
ncbi:MAG TPA: hypothetical protein VK509_07935 [Polyangiales bacterium]|nr:hypothetical protein [Polyangiales bacterium]